MVDALSRGKLAREGERIVNKRSLLETAAPDRGAGGGPDPDAEEAAGHPASELERIELELLLEGIYRLYGFDFRNYAKSSLTRRVRNRMRIDGIASITSLLDKVLRDRSFMDKLLRDFSINVTEMFRDPLFFRAFRTSVVPHLRDLPEIRIWHAGCATGEEAYSMAILMEEEGLADKTTIYATDMNEQALELARRGAYPLKQMQAFTKNYLEAGGSNAFSEYYTADHRYAYFDLEMKKRMLFAQHNLVTDGSFNEFHVIICRNVLIYFDPVLQSQVHDLLYESLTPGGFLGLGSKESIMMLETASKKYNDFLSSERIYRKGC